MTKRFADPIVEGKVWKTKTVWKAIVHPATGQVVKARVKLCEPGIACGDGYLKHPKRVRKDGGREQKYFVKALFRQV